MIRKGFITTKSEMPNYFLQSATVQLRERKCAALASLGTIHLVRELWLPENILLLYVTIKSQTTADIRLYQHFMVYLAIFETTCGLL